MKFSYKLIIVLLSVSISAVVLFSIANYNNSSKYILTLEKNNLSEKSLIIQKQMDHYLSQSANFIFGLGTNPRILNFLSDRSYEKTDEINFLLDKIQNFNSDEYSAIFLIDKSGFCRASTDRRFIGTDYSFRLYYQNVIDKRNNLFVSDYSIGLRSLIPGIFFSIPLEDDNGFFTGVLVVKISGNYLQEKIDELNNFEKSIMFSDEDIENIKLFKNIDIPDLNPEAFIINQDGIIIMHPDPGRLFHSITDLSPDTVNRLRESQQFLGRKITSLDEPVLGQLHREALQAQKPMTSVYRNEKEASWHVLALAPLENNRWCIGVSMSYDEFLLSSHELLVKTVVISIIVLIAVLAAALYLSQVITRPMNYLMMIISDAMNKNWSIRFKSDNNDEFSFLGERFNELMDIIEDYSMNMEQQVRERTEEVINLQRENTRLRIMEEKERLYRDLHDSLGARLTNINICNNVAKSIIHNDMSRTEEMLVRIDANCEQAIEDMKNLLSEGASEMFNEELFGPKMVERFRKRLSLQNIELKTKIPDRNDFPPLSKEIYHELNMILEELITNVLKHAYAKKIRLIVSFRKNEMILEFTDNGIGMKEKSIDRGYGLGNIEKRTARLNSELIVNTLPGRGTSYLIKIPLEKAGAEINE